MADMFLTALVTCLESADWINLVAKDRIHWVDRLIILTSD